MTLLGPDTDEYVLGFDTRIRSDVGDDTVTASYPEYRTAEAAGRADTVVACGGDGTLNKTVKGVQDVDRLDAVSLGVIPAGTGNDFADNIGIRGVEHAFEVIESDEYRQLDLGMVNGRPFLNSCVGGLTAESSAKTSRSLKRRLGVVAYVLTTLSVARDFESLSLWVSTGPDRNPVWSGEALMLLVGNGRRFPGEQMRQANMEDGLVNVVIIEGSQKSSRRCQGVGNRLQLVFRECAIRLIRVRGVDETCFPEDGSSHLGFPWSLVRVNIGPQCVGNRRQVLFRELGVDVASEATTGLPDFVTEFVDCRCHGWR